MSKDYESMTPRDFNNPGRETLSDADIGSVGLVLLSLTKEIWIIRDRLAVMEAVLAEKGIDIREDIEAYQPDREMRDALREQGNQLVSEVLNTLANISPKAEQDE